MAEPKIRFKKDDGSNYPAWKKHSVGDMTTELTEYMPLACGMPLLTSARTGLMFQDEYRGKNSTENGDTMFSVVPRGAVTYRHMSDDNIFHFNINELVDAGLVSKEYPVFNTVNGNNTKLLVEYLNSSGHFLEFCKAQKKGGTRTRLYFKVLKDFELLFPCPEEQQKIADFLSSVDEVITASEEEVANLETQKKSVMKKIFSQEVRFKRTDETEFPEWEEKQMGEVINLLSGQDFPPEQYNDEGFGTPYLTGASCILNNKTTAVRWTKTPKNIVKFGDILIVCKGSGSGTVAIVDQQEAHIARQFMCIRPINQLDSKYCYHQVCEMTEDIRSEARGTIPGIDRKTVLQRTISIPCLEEQRLIADFLSDFDEVIAAAKRELELWKELKKGLLQQMFI